MLQPSGPSARTPRPLGPSARRAMPPSHDVARQPATFVSLADLGVQPELFLRAASSQGVATEVDIRMNEVGFMLASKWQLEDPGFEPRAGLFVNVTGSKSDGECKYNGKQMVRVAVLHAACRDGSLRSAVPRVMEAFSQGKRVCVHSRHGFHRAPVVFAAVCRAMFGISTQASMEVLSETRFIWWEHVCGRNTGSELSNALQWAEGLHCWLPEAAPSQGGVAASSQGGAAGQALASTVKGKKGAPARRYVYRAMTKDLLEFDSQPVPQWRGEELAYEILRAVETGWNGADKTAWLHCSWLWSQARLWREWGRKKLGHLDSVICRIDIIAVEEWACSQDPLAGHIDLERGMLVGQFFDMSTAQSMAHLQMYEGSGRVDNLFGALKRSKASREVLLCWRGHVPRRFFEIVDEVRGIFVRSMVDTEEVPL